jgi:hypothetical protein
MSQAFLKPCQMWRTIHEHINLDQEHVFGIFGSKSRTGASQVRGRQVRGRCVADAWQVRGRCMAGAWQARGRCVAGAWQLRAKRVTGACKVRSRCAAYFVSAIRQDQKCSQRCNAYANDVSLYQAHHNIPNGILFSNAWQATSTRPQPRTRDRIG